MIFGPSPWQNKSIEKGGPRAKSWGGKKTKHEGYGKKISGERWTGPGFTTVWARSAWDKGREREEKMFLEGKQTNQKTAKQTPVNCIQVPEADVKNVEVGAGRKSEKKHASLGEGNQYTFLNFSS